LAEVEPRIQRRQREPQRIHTSAEVTGKLVEFMWKLKREGYAEATITDYTYILKTLAKRGADLYDKIMSRM